MLILEILMDQTKTQIKIISFNDDVLMFQKWHVPNSDIYNKSIFRFMEIPNAYSWKQNEFRKIASFSEFNFQVNNRELSFQVIIPTSQSFELHYYHFNWIQSSKWCKPNLSTSTWSRQYFSVSFWHIIFGSISSSIAFKRWDHLVGNIFPI